MSSSFTVSYSAQMQVDRLPGPEREALSRLFASDEIRKLENTRRMPTGRFVSRLGERRVLWQPDKNGRAEILSIVDRSYAD